MGQQRAAPPACDPEVYANGKLVLVRHTIGAQAMEELVRKIAARSGQRVDWHYAGGRACILALGDLTKVRAAILDLQVEHDRLQREAASEFSRDGAREFTTSWMPYSDEESNPMYEMARRFVIEQGLTGEREEDE